MQQFQGSLEKVVHTFLVCSLSHVVHEDGVKVDHEGTKNFVVYCDASRKSWLCIDVAREVYRFCIKAIEESEIEYPLVTWSWQP